jgi:polyisoprenoid-binding protein YceI
MVIAVATACSNTGGEKTETGHAVKTKDASFDTEYILNPLQSIIEWEGYKPTGQHHGTVNISGGNLRLKDKAITGGKFTFDMTSIKVIDIENPQYNAKLTYHLKSADFFGVQAFPGATFEITGIQPINAAGFDRSKEKGNLIPTHAITGNLTIKGISKSITFNAKIDQSDSSITAESNQFFIDRTEWNVQYKSKKLYAQLKDDFVNDEIGIKLKIATQAENKEITSKTL